MRKIQILCLLVASFAMADVHPGLKNAIDKGDIKTAQTLIEKFSIKDVYCPASLEVSDAVTMYGDRFRNDPGLLFQKCSPEFVQKFGKYVCINKDNMKLCKSYMDRARPSDLGIYYGQILESGWHKEDPTTNYDWVEQGLISDDCRYYSEQYLRNQDSKNQCRGALYEANHIAFDLLEAEKKIVGATNKPWLRRKEERIPKDLYTQHQRVVLEYGYKIYPIFNWVTDSLSSESLAKVYAKLGTFPDSTILGACRRNKNIDKIFEKNMGLNLFSCSEILKKYDDRCTTGDKTRKKADGVGHRLICEADHWVDVSKEDFAAFDVFPYACNQERAGKTVESMLNNVYRQYVCDGSKWTTLSISVGNLVWMTKNLNKKREKSKCANEKQECGEEGRIYSDEVIDKICPQGWDVPTRENWEYLGEHLSEAVKNGLQIDGEFWINGGYEYAQIYGTQKSKQRDRYASYGTREPTLSFGGSSVSYFAVRCVKEKPKKLSNPIPNADVAPVKKK